MIYDNSYLLLTTLALLAAQFSLDSYLELQEVYSLILSWSMASTPASRLLSRERLAGWVPHFTDLAQHSPSFSTLTATVQTLQEALSSGHLRSTQLVEEYQRSICLHNEWLGAVYQLAPGAMDRASEMDALRQDGTILGALHGIPILFKVGKVVQLSDYLLKII